MTTHPAAASIEALLAECHVTRGRRSGPGGQHRNKVETAIVIEHEPTGARAEASERRSQEQNRQLAIRRLRLRLALEVRTPLERQAIAPTALWRSRVSGGRIAVSTEHDDFPALLAEALDAVAACEMDVKAAAEALCVSSSQLIKLLKQEPKALAEVNRRRAELGAPPLK
ncbi:MAG: peptide chain release factor-like protein [Pirellulaceae bacterium]